jgi:two-component system LytT family response regulator
MSLAAIHLAALLAYLYSFVPSEFMIERRNVFAWTVWDIVAYATIVMFGTIATLAGRHREALVAMIATRSRIANARLASLRLRLQPAVLLRGLDAIGVAMSTDPEQAEHTIARMGDLLRALLTGVDRDSVSLDTELATLRAFVDVVAPRATIATDDTVRDAIVPAVLLTPLAAALAELSSIDIRSTDKTLDVHLHASSGAVDDGQVAHIRERVRRRYRGDATLSVVSDHRRRMRHQASIAYRASGTRGRRLVVRAGAWCRVTNTLRVFIADDEADARDKLRRLLARNLDTILVGEATNGLETVERVRALRPDLVLLDIRMPAMDGLRAIEMLGAHLPSSPKVVFVTAYDEYAVKAFEVRAFDYLLKPFDAERLDAALERVRRQIDLEHRPEASALQSLFDRLQDGAHAEAVTARGDKYLERVRIQSAGRVEIVHMREVEWIEACGNYARLHTPTRRPMLREPLRSLDEQLDPSRFARIHRSAIVNLDRIREMRPTASGDYVVRLESGFACA